MPACQCHCVSVGVPVPLCQCIYISENVSLTLSKSWCVRAPVSCLCVPASVSVMFLPLFLHSYFTNFQFNMVRFKHTSPTIDRDGELSWWEGVVLWALDPGSKLRTSNYSYRYGGVDETTQTISKVHSVYDYFWHWQWFRYFHPYPRRHWIMYIKSRRDNIVRCAIKQKRYIYIQ